MALVALLGACSSEGGDDTGATAGGTNTAFGGTAAVSTTGGAYATGGIAPTGGSGGFTASTGGTGGVAGTGAVGATGGFIAGGTGGFSGATGGIAGTGGVGGTGGVVTGGTGGFITGGTGGVVTGGIGGVVTGGTGGFITGGTGGVSGTGAVGATGGFITGGTGGTGASGGGGGTGGLGGSGGDGGGGGSTTCSFDVNHELSSAIPTVGIVTWSATPAVTSAYIEFGLQGSSEVMEAPVDLSEVDYRTLLLGMKQQQNYVFRIVAETGAGTCVSDDYDLTTGTLSNAPSVTQSGSGTSAMHGFIITTTMGGMGGGSSTAYIFDTDGDVVWAASAPSSPSRARMSWDGRDMWMLASNNMGTTTSGEMRRASMDGLDVENNVAGLSGAHHDFTVLPDNGLAVISFNSSGCIRILERSASGVISDIVSDVSSLYEPSGDCHANYIQYYESDDTFTLSDRNPNLFVKFRRDGTLLWQFGGSNPRGSAFSVGETWQVNHGHELTEDGRFVFFNNGSMMGGSSLVMEFQLNESNMTATKLWQFTTSGSSGSLGGVQRLPDGHYLVAVSNAGVIEEIDGSQNIVRSFSSSGCGYAEYRESLYGPPVRY